MFGEKLRNTITDSTSRITSQMQSDSLRLERNLREQTQQISRQSNSSEVLNDLELMKMGFQSTYDVPEGKRIHGLWKPSQTTDARGMENWSYGEAFVTLGTVTYDEEGKIDEYAKDSEQQRNDLRYLVGFVKKYSNPDEFRHDTAFNDHGATLHYILKGKVKGFWSDMETKDFYTMQRPSWWKIVD